MADSIQHPGDDLNRTERALLGAYRSAHTMPASIKARIGARLDAGGEADFQLRNPGIQLRNPTMKWAWSAAGVGLAAAAGLIWSLTTRAVDPTRSGPSSPPTQAALQAETPAQPLTASQRRNRPSEASAPGLEADARAPGLEADANSAAPGAGELAALSIEPPPDPPTEAAPANPRSKPRRVGATSTDRSPPNAAPIGASDAAAATPLGLDVERALLARAWADLAAGDPDTALALALEHRSKFPTGVLNIEGQAIAAIASCQSGRADGPRTAQRFLAAHGRTPLAPRVREACATANER